MNEIYWITRLDGILKLGTIMTILSLAVFIASAFMYFMFSTSYEDTGEEKDKMKSMIKISIPLLVFGALIMIFVPSKRDMYAIYGIGSVVDYVRDNDNVRELPDKAVERIIYFLDEYGKEVDR